ncbi:effector-associated constant component EACC1 [Streptomyces sp. BH106]|uniref:effector-associated constant component EACC1 n=1 Tax=Streptomyces sp. BH106 TaxID=3410409 RepID=UPI003CF9D5C2
MQLDVCVAGPQPEDDLRSLHDWLRREPAVRETARLGLRDAPAASGTMGSALDVLELVTGNGWSAAAFIMPVVTWRSTRPRRPRVTVCRQSTSSQSSGPAALVGVIRQRVPFFPVCREQAVLCLDSSRGLVAPRHRSVAHALLAGEAS